MAIGDPKPKRRKKSARKILEDRLDELVRLVLRATRPRYCVTCGKPETDNERLQVGHWIKRGRWRVRWDLRNVHPQCSGCNYRHNMHPFYYDQYMIGRFGDKVCLELTGLAHIGGKLSMHELAAIETKLKELL